MVNQDICPVCESKIANSSQACEVCGADLKLLSGNSKAQFVCPECGTELLAEDTSCPKCGVQFDSEERVVFQCPACSTEVDASANSCPKCGAEFLSEEEASAPAEVPKGIDSVPSVKVQDATTFDDLAHNVTTGNPEELISEVEEKLKVMDAPLQSPAPLTQAPRKQEPAVLHSPPPPVVPASQSEANEEAGEKRSRFHFRFGRKKEENEPSAAEEPSSRQPEPPSAVRQPTHPAAAQATRPLAQAPSARTAAPDTEEMRKLVEQLRKLLKFAGGAGIDISDGKNYLDMSVDLVKSGDSSEALRQIRLSYKSIEGDIQSYFRDKMEIMRKQIEIENVAGERKQLYENRLSTISDMLRKASYDEALQTVQRFQSELSPKASQFGEAKELLDRLDELLRYADEIGIDYNSSRMIFTEAKKHLAVGDWSSALVLAKQTRDSLMRSIPDKLLSEMNRARSEIIDAKLNGMKVTDYISTLKEASNAYNDGKYDESLRFMNIFRREFDRARSLSSGSHSS